MNKFDLVHVFKDKNIGMIVNLQREGEHPYCGPNEKLEFTGFSYIPEVFISEGISVMAYGWKDMDVPDSVSWVLKIVKDMCEMIYIHKKKVLVHCHAGYGRTGIVIACYMIYTTDKPVERVVGDIRAIRSKCIEKDEQYNYCVRFKEYIDRSKIIFGDMRLELEIYLKSQNELYYGKDNIKYRNIPKLIPNVLERILDINEDKSYESLYEIFYSELDWSEEDEEIIVRLKQNINQDNWGILKEVKSVQILVTLLFDWFEDCLDFAIQETKINKIYDEETIDIMNNFLLNEKNNDKREDRKKISNRIKFYLKLSEFEILITIAQFLSFISPVEDHGNEVTSKYISMLDRICSLLLGYHKNPNNAQRQNILKLRNILLLFEYEITNELDNDEEEYYKHRTENQLVFSTIGLSEHLNYIGNNPKSSDAKQSVDSAQFKAMLSQKFSPKKK